MTARHAERPAAAEGGDGAIRASAGLLDQDRRLPDGTLSPSFSVPPPCRRPASMR
ncbi:MULTISPECIES: hypothetical protein [unclassified Streptomyces]|uniref:hypothetical protein n=1 Tax=unclassified Streptomyces TaxID=2593676 RepID=UPI000AC33177|nr:MULTISPECIES: hypothetical protein [unclassified Streptomyces]